MQKNLNESGIYEKIYVTGNTVIDSLMISSKVTKPKLLKINWDNERVILVTAHQKRKLG